MKNSKYKEILKLKEMLEKEGIPFEYYDSTYKDFEHYQVVYPSYENMICSCIEGFGTYGSINDRLEIMGLLTKQEEQYDSVVGYLTAEEVFRRIKEDYKKRRVENGL